MSKTTEGVILTSSQAEAENKVKEVGKVLNNQYAASETSLQYVSRQKFVDNIELALSEASSSIPSDIKASLDTLKNAIHAYLCMGHEDDFIALYNHAIKKTGQGWGYLSYWVSNEQASCYQVYWQLKSALEKHNKNIKNFKQCKNDGCSAEALQQTNPTVSNKHGHEEQCTNKNKTLNFHGLLHYLGFKAK